MTVKLRKSSNNVVGFTGTQHGMTRAQAATVRHLLTELGPGEFHHGDCIGSDSQAHDIADECGYGIILHPPTNYSKRAWREVLRHMMRAEYPYLTRNRHIVDASDVVIAIPREAAEQPSGGTWSTVRYARRRGKRLHVILPDGRVL